MGCTKYGARCLLRQKLARLIQKVVVDLVVTEELREPGFNLRQMS